MVQKTFFLFLISKFIWGILDVFPKQFLVLKIYLIYEVQNAMLKHKDIQEGDFLDLAVKRIFIY